MIILSILLMIPAGFFNALMDLSSEGLFEKPVLNKTTGWKRKYKNGDEEQGERFPLSTTVFVGFTDGWHFFQLCFHTCWQLAISINFGLHGVWIFFVLKIIFGLTFQPIYKNWKKKLIKNKQTNKQS